MSDHETDTRQNRSSSSSSRHSSPPDEGDKSSEETREDVKNPPPEAKRQEIIDGTGYWFYDPLYIDLLRLSHIIAGILAFFGFPAWLYLSGNPKGQSRGMILITMGFLIILAIILVMISWDFSKHVLLLFDPSSDIIEKRFSWMMGFLSLSRESVIDGDINEASEYISKANRQMDDISPLSSKISSYSGPITSFTDMAEEIAEFASVLLNDAELARENQEYDKANAMVALGEDILDIADKVSAYRSSAFETGPIRQRVSVVRERIRATKLLECAQSRLSEGKYGVVLENCGAARQKIEKTLEADDFDKKSNDKTLLARIEKICQQATFAKERDSATERLKCASASVTSGEYQSALEDYETAQTHFKKALRLAENIELEDATDTDVVSTESDLDHIRDDIESALSRIETHIIDCHVAVANQRLAHATALLDESRYEEAEDTFESITRYLDEIEQADELIVEVMEKARSGHKSALIGQVNQQLQRAKSLFDDGEYAEAENEFAATLEFIQRIEYDGEKIEEIRNTGREGYVQSWIEQGREILQQGVGRFDAEEYYEARETFEEAREHLESVRSEAQEYDLDDKVTELDDHIETCKANADRARRALLDLDADSSVPAFSSRDVAPSLDFDLPDIDLDIAQSEQPQLGVDENLRQELPDHEILCERFGIGGNADVHKIRLTDSNEIVALKVPRWQGTLSTEVAFEFVREAQLWEQIDGHEHIVDIIEWGTEPYPWMLLEFMEAGSLDHRIDTLDWSESVAMLQMICEATNYAHHQGIAHADLKPQNILFSETDQGEVLKIGDWGLARLLLEHSKSLDQLTPGYAAPEQIDPDEYGSVDTHTDIYQIGVIAYELLTGRRPFEGESHTAVTNAVLNTDPAPPSEVNPEIATEVDEVVLKALEKRKENRYEDVLYFRDGLQ